MPVDVTFDGAGPHLVEAVVTAEGDVLPDNNTLSREVIVEPRPRVLYVHADGGRCRRRAARAHPDRLPGHGRRGLQTLPTRPEALDAWDVVVLSNVGRAQLSPAAMTALGSWVEERGGGLLIVGGSHGVRRGRSTTPQLGYRRTDIERVLPVTFDRDDEPEVALASCWIDRGA